VRTVIENVKKGLGDRIIEWREHSPRRIYVTISPKEVRYAANLLFNEINARFATATGQDTPAGMEILYHFSFDKTGQIFSLRVLLPDKKKPEVDSLATMFPAAEWIEREMWELLGINFKGHPNLKHLLLIDEWPEGECPLRHDHKHEHDHEHEHDHDHEHDDGHEHDK